MARFIEKLSACSTCSLSFLLLLLLPVTLVATPHIQHWKTSNGARVLFVEAPDLPMVDVRVIFDAGSARDGDIPGLALMTNSTLSDGAGIWDADDIALRLENVGADLSADSLRDMGIVALRSLTEKEALDTASSTMAEVLANPAFRQTDIDRNLQALTILLRQEEQSPSSVATKAFYKNMYGEHPYGHPSSGNKESIEKITRNAMEDFYQQFYVAENAVVSVVGALSRQEAEKLVEKIIGRLPAGQAAQALPMVKSADKGQRQIIDFPSKQAHLKIGLPVLSRGDPDHFPLYVGNHILGGSGLISRLSVEIREKRGLAYSAFSYFSPMRGPGPFMIGLQTKNSQAEEAERVVMQTLRDYMDSGPSEEELKHAKQNITGGFPLRIASNKKIIQYLGLLGFYDLPLDYLDTFVERVNAVTVEQIKDAFKRRVNPDELTVIAVGQIES